MRFLLTGNKKHLSVLSPDTYGVETWGSSSQDSLKKMRKNWYFTNWTSGGIWGKDTYTKAKCPVLLETKDPDKIILYIHKHFRDKTKMNDKKLTEMLESVLNDIEAIYQDWLSLERWCLK